MRIGRYAACLNVIVRNSGRLAEDCCNEIVEAVGSLGDSTCHISVARGSGFQIDVMKEGNGKETSFEVMGYVFF
jgi:hypothetical protein